MVIQTQRAEWGLFFFENLRREQLEWRKMNDEGKGNNVESRKKLLHIAGFQRHICRFTKGNFTVIVETGICSMWKYHTQHTKPRCYAITSHISIHQLFTTISLSLVYGDVCVIPNRSLDAWKGWWMWVNGWKLKAETRAGKSPLNLFGELIFSLNKTRILKPTDEGWATCMNVKIVKCFRLSSVSRLFFFFLNWCIPLPPQKITFTRPQLHIYTFNSASNAVCPSDEHWICGDMKQSWITESWNLQSGINMKKISGNYFHICQHLSLHYSGVELGENKVETSSAEWKLF